MKTPEIRTATQVIAGRDLAPPPPDMETFIAEMFRDAVMLLVEGMTANYIYANQSRSDLLHTSPPALQICTLNAVARVKRSLPSTLRGQAYNRDDIGRIEEKLFGEKQPVENLARICPQDGQVENIFDARFDLSDTAQMTLSRICALQPNLQDPHAISILTGRSIIDHERRDATHIIWKIDEQHDLLPRLRAGIVDTNETKQFGATTLPVKIEGMEDRPLQPSILDIMGRTREFLDKAAAYQSEASNAYKRSRKGLPSLGRL